MVRGDPPSTRRPGRAHGLPNDVAFSPDGRTLASAGDELTVRLWDVPGRRPWATLTGHTNAVWGVAFAPGGRTVASSSNDGTVRLWDLDVRARLDRICRLPQGGGPAGARGADAGAARHPLYRVCAALTDAAGPAAGKGFPLPFRRGVTPGARPVTARSAG
ncbi:WD40 repeat domain-containing protein [Streptomyces longwoodensis]|uniref:WD40 repeat domain-containing protein n=1 Tax=Streptomyces longwoodensis TaxID=68231 RepID=UPI0036EFB529